MLNLEPIKERLDKSKYDLRADVVQDLFDLISEVEYLREECSLVRKTKRTLMKIILESFLNIQQNRFNTAKAFLVFALAAEDDEIYWESLSSLVQELQESVNNNA